MERSRKAHVSLYGLERSLNPFSLWSPEAGVSRACARREAIRRFATPGP